MRAALTGIVLSKLGIYVLRFKNHINIHIYAVEYVTGVFTQNGVWCVSGNGSANVAHSVVTVCNRRPTYRMCGKMPSQFPQTSLFPPPPLCDIYVEKA